MLARTGLAALLFAACLGQALHAAAAPANPQPFDVQPPEGGSAAADPDEGAAFVGPRQMLVILADFADRPAHTTAAQWQRRVFAATNSVRHHYRTASYGALTITPAAESHGVANDGVVGWLRLSGTHPAAGSGDDDARMRALAMEAMTAAAVHVDFAAFDANGDDIVSAHELMVIVIVAGFDLAGGCEPGVWSHTASSVDVNDGLRLSPYAVVAELHCDPADSAATAPAPLAVLVHETGHLLGLPDLSDADGSGRLTVTTPNGGEVWPIGTSQIIQWTSENVTGDVKIELSRDGGTSWTTLFEAAANDGRRVWTVRGAATNRARIRICGVATPAICDASRANFAIGRTLRLRTPNGGQIWKVNTSHTITWASSMVTGNVTIALSRDGGATWTTLFANVANDGAEAWTPAVAPTTRARIRVCSVEAPVICDRSDADFNITTGVIILHTPNGGESWLKGDPEMIGWTSTVVGNVRLELSRDGGATWSVLVASAANDGLHVWTVTGPATTQARLRVCSVRLPEVCDRSDAAFSIVVPPPAQVRFLNDLCLEPDCTPFTARLRAAEGYRWSSRSGVASAYQDVMSGRLSDFVLSFDFTTDRARCTACVFTLVPGLRYMIVLTASGGDVVLGLVFEGSVNPLPPRPEAAPPAALRGVPADRFRLLR